LPILFLSLTIIARGGDAGNNLLALLPLNTPAHALLQGTLIAMALFVGIEATPAVSEEVKNARRIIPKATGIALYGVAFLYLLVTYASSIGFGLDHVGRWITDTTPLTTLALRYVGGWFTIFLELALMLNALTAVSAFTSVIAKGTFALARHGFLPSVFGRTTHFRSWSVIPLLGNLGVLCCALVMIVIFTAANIDPLLGFGIMATWGILLVMTTYLILALAAIPLLMHGATRWWHWGCLVVALVMPFLVLYASMVPFPFWPANIALYGAFLTAAAAIIWISILHMFRPDLLKAAAEPYAWEDNLDEELEQA
jgi:amino acid transporter